MYPDLPISRASNPQPSTDSVLRRNLASVTSLANTTTKLGAEHFCFYPCPGILLQTKTAKLGTPTPIRTEKTAPFERADFTNLSIRALIFYGGS